MEHIKEAQQNAHQAKNFDWEQLKTNCKDRMYSHIMKQLNNRVKTLYRLNKQATRGKNYIRLTDYKFAFNNPLAYLHVEAQLEILQELVAEMRETIKTLYGPEFMVKVELSPPKLSKVMTWVFYDIYAFYDDNDSDNSDEDDNYSSSNVSNEYDVDYNNDYVSQLD